MKTFIFIITALATIAVAKGSKCSFSSREWKICVAAKAELDGIAGIKEDFMPDALVARLNASISSAVATAPQQLKENLMVLGETLYNFNRTAVETNNIIVRRLKQTTEKITAAGNCLNQMLKLEGVYRLSYVACEVADEYQAIAKGFKQAVIEEYQKFQKSFGNFEYVNQRVRELCSELEKGDNINVHAVIVTESRLKNLTRDFEVYQSAFLQGIRNMDDKAVAANEKFMKLAQVIKASPPRVPRYGE